MIQIAIPYAYGGTICVYTYGMLPYVPYTVRNVLLW